MCHWFCISFSSDFPYAFISSGNGNTLFQSCLSVGRWVTVNDWSLAFMDDMAPNNPLKITLVDGPPMPGKSSKILAMRRRRLWPNPESRQKARNKMTPRYIGILVSHKQAGTPTFGAIKQPSENIPIDSKCFLNRGRWRGKWRDKGIARCA